ncbi:MAG TPA: hypothetical protein PKE52_07105 [Bacteroidales bacterium]|jgi:hypothetical protein|nr:hypothetical protein [Bacteroidales bacterium]
MPLSPKTLQILYYLGVTALLLGAIDPLEGSILIASGATLLTAVSLFKKDRHKTIFLLSTIGILLGVGLMWFFSSLGGFGGNSGRPMWYGVFLLPYPLGWLAIVITLLVRLFKPKK